MRALARSFDASQADGFGGAIALELVGIDDCGTTEVWGVAVAEGRATARSEAPPRPSLTVTTDIPSLVRVVAGQSEIAQPLREGRAAVRGNLLVAARLDEVFRPGGRRRRLATDGARAARQEGGPQARRSGSR